MSDKCHKIDIILSHLKEYSKVISHGKESVQMYHLQGVYSIRRYMSVVARYVNLEERISSLRNGILRMNSNSESGEEINVKEVYTTLISIKKDLNALVKSSGLWKLWGCMRFFLKNPDIYMYIGGGYANETVDRYDRSGVLLRHFHPIRIHTYHVKKSFTSGNTPSVSPRGRQNMKSPTFKVRNLSSSSLSSLQQPLAKQPLTQQPSESSTPISTTPTSNNHCTYTFTPHVNSNVTARSGSMQHDSSYRQQPSVSYYTGNWLAITQFHALSEDGINASTNANAGASTNANAGANNDIFIDGQLRTSRLSEINNMLILHVHGCSLHFYETETNRLIIMDGYMDNLDITRCDYEYVRYKLDIFRGSKKMKTRYFTQMLNSLSLRDILIYDKTTILQHYSQLHTRFKSLKQNKISHNIILFDKSKKYERYSMIYMFLLDIDTSESSYIAYLLYDLLTNSTIASLDSVEQRHVFACFTYNLKIMFRHVMQATIDYTRKVVGIEPDAVPYEQQICLMHCSDYVKQKAMVKFKEVKNRSDDSSSKAKQYLDGLLKIPFGQFYTEEVMQYKKLNNMLYTNVLESYNALHSVKLTNLHDVSEGVGVLGNDVNQEQMMSSKGEDGNISQVDILKDVRRMRESYYDKLYLYIRSRLMRIINGMSRSTMTNVVIHLNGMIRSVNATLVQSMRKKKLCHSGRNKEQIIQEVLGLVEWGIQNHEKLLMDVMDFFKIKLMVDLGTMNEVVNQIVTNNAYICNYMREVRLILDRAVYGHENAKNHMQRIIAQWINGESSGKCIGFEGPPGCGKTSFAKNGVSRCLYNSDGTHRPFAFIAMGGTSNASFLEGHSYTYVGSTWGKIVDILMDKQCMNPIIFIDELDKVSRTEHGKEINGILTHLIDSTQNNEFYDKYFTGVPLDLSRVLFIFSYNDTSLIDKVVLDRIHRIKFDSLSVDDKVVVVRKHILPELLREVGLYGNVTIGDETVRYIIQNYTRESGVRKLKELLYEIVSEINLRNLTESGGYVFPYEVGEEEVREVFLKEKPIYLALRPSSEALVGVVNGLWANTLKEGGVLSIEASMYPTETFLEFKLTGMQGEVMRESMQVAKTVVWSLLLTDEERGELYEYFKRTKMQGIHIHCPEGSTPKDGPSAGMAITLALYSTCLSLVRSSQRQVSGDMGEGCREEIKERVRVRSGVAMTGEINLRGEIGEIGGLDSKILGGLNVGIGEFLYPSSNERDLMHFKEKFGGRFNLSGVNFRGVSHIREIVGYMLV